MAKELTLKERLNSLTSEQKKELREALGPDDSDGDFTAMLQKFGVRLEAIEKDISEAKKKGTKDKNWFDALLDFKV